MYVVNTMFTDFKKIYSRRVFCTRIGLRIVRVRGRDMWPVPTPYK